MGSGTTYNYIKSLSRFLAAAVMSFPALLNAQHAEWSPLEDIDKKYPYCKITGQDAHGLYLLKSNLPIEMERNRVGLKSRKYALAYYSSSLEKKWERPVKAPGSYKVEAVLPVNGKIAVLTSSGNDSRASLWLSTLNNKGSFDSLSFLLDTTYSSSSSFPGIQTLSSTYGNRIALLYRAAASHSDQQVVKAVIMDEKLAVTGTKNIEIPYSHSRLAVIGAALAENGYLYLLGSRYLPGQQSGSDGKVNFFLIASEKNNQPARIQEVIEKEKSLNDAAIAVDEENHKVVVAGFYSENTAYSTAGTFYVSFDMDSVKEKTVTCKRFDQKFIDEFIGEKKTEDGKELIHYAINRIVARSDGGVVLSAEANFVTEYSFYDVFTQSFITRTTYNYNNIVVASVNPDGSTDWLQVVNKSQSSSEDGGYYSSFCSLVADDKLFFLFNKYNNRKNEVLVNAISSQGSRTTTRLFSEIDNVFIIPRAAAQTQGNALVIPCYKKKKFCLLKISV